MKSFRLPTGNTTGEFQSLYTQYPTYDQMRKYPVGMVLSGRYSWVDGTLNYQGWDGDYWSSSAYASVDHAYYLGLYGSSNTVYTAASGLKRGGFALRCLAKNQTKNKKSLKLNKNKQIKQNKRKWEKGKGKEDCL